jgi:hypothetical protein
MADLSPSPAADPAGSVRRTAGILAVLVTFSCLYFFSGGGWNQASHLDLVRALVHERGIAIDSFHQNTGDKSRRDGHYYCNKGPGTAFFAAPFVEGLWEVARLFGV